MKMRIFRSGLKFKRPERSAIGCSGSPPFSTIESSCYSNLENGKVVFAPGGAAQPQSLGSRRCSATIVSSPSEIAELEPFVRTLVTEPGMLAPRFFLASLVVHRWEPHVVVVSRDQRVLGLFYCKELVLAGVRTRIAYFDDALGAMVAASPEDAGLVIRSAVELLLKRMVGLRFLVPVGRLVPLLSVQSVADLDFRRAEPHDHLELPRTYDEFLAKLGPCTRRNFRRYRRRSELAGNEFVPDQTFPDFCSAARRLFPKAAYAGDRGNFERCLAMIEAMPSRVLVGLRRKGGEWIGLAGGWHIGDRTILLAQLNDRDSGRASISTLLRSYLIEALIGRGTRELIFWANSSDPLSWHCTSPETFVAYIDSRSLPWRLVRRASAIVEKVVPRKLSKLLEWIVPDEGAKLTQLWREHPSHEQQGLRLEARLPEVDR